MKNPRISIWTVVRMQRGFITETSLFRSAQQARACEERWRAVSNPDYDETALFRKRITLPTELLK